MNSRIWYQNPEKRKIRLHRERVTHWETTAVSRATFSCRKNDRVCSITVDDVKALWVEQKGLCFWTSVPLIPSVGKRDPQRPSLDRLDNDIGYVAGNVVLASAFANIGRQSASADRMRDFMIALRECCKK